MSANAAGRWGDAGCYSTIRKSRRNISVADADGREVALVHEAKDAHLVIAAPELLEELQHCLRLLEHRDVGFKGNPALIAAHAAVKRARGES